MTNKKVYHGFTLVELLVTCTIIAILILIGMILYTPQVRHGRRSDAVNTLLSISLAEERYRSNNASYGTIAQVWGGVTTTPGGYYTLTITNLSATAYTITATAVGDQASDAQSGTACTPMVLTTSAGTVSRTPAICWPS